MEKKTTGGEMEKAKERGKNERRGKKKRRTNDHLGKVLADHFRGEIYLKGRGMIN